MACCLLFPPLHRQRSAMARLGYQPLLQEAKAERMMTVVVGKEKREFLIYPVVIERDPFRVLLEMMRKNVRETKQGVIFVDVDAISFEHLLWLMGNDFSSFRHLDLAAIKSIYVGGPCSDLERQRILLNYEVTYLRSALDEPHYYAHKDHFAIYILKTWILN